MTVPADMTYSGDRTAADPAPVVSVIVPVYNVERYLAECLDSLLAQTFHDFEIVVVDDGSTDGSAALVERYAARSPERIHAVRKPNGGLGDARNFGMSHARGAYLAFVDADDTVTREFLEHLVGCARERDAEFVICGTLGFTDGSSEAGDFYPEPDMSVFGRSLAEEPRLLYRVDASACNKLYARTLFERTGIRFPVGIAFEDLPTTYRLLPAANRVEKVDEPLYRYRQRRADSITYAYGANFLDLVEGFRILDDHYAAEGIFEPNREPLLRLHLVHLIAGRYPDFFLRADAASRRAFVDAAFGLLGERFGEWPTSPVCRELWPDPRLRAIGTRKPLLLAFCRVPDRAYLAALSRMGAFDPLR